jgi:exopolysaccharide/PEP-CTERM locus tyrosine autokinase
MAPDSGRRVSIVEKAMQKIQDRVAAARGDAVVDLVVAPAAAPGGARTRQVRADRPRILLDQSLLREKGLLPPAAEDAQIARHFRHIKRPLVAKALAIKEKAGALPDAGVILVASAVPGEGKTFTAMNLAFSLAREKDATVLLIDADVAKPHISSVLGLQGTPGLLDAVANPALDVETMIHETDVPGLSVLGAGEQQELATELLASENMTTLISRLRSNEPRRIVLLDSPPLLLTTESRELGSVAGQVVLVVRAGQTPRETVYDAIDMFPEDKSIGLVLNQVSASSADGAYYGYGRYGSAYGARDEASNGRDQSS